MLVNAAKMAIPSILGLFRVRRGPAIPSFFFQKETRILLIKQSERLGNIVLMNTAINGLARALPQAKIDLLLSEIYRDVMRANSDINEIIQVRKKEYITQPWKLLSLLGSIRKRRYDLAIDCSDVNSHSSTGAIYAILSGAELIAGWRLLSRQQFDIEVERYDERLHASEMYVRLFSGIFGKVISGHPYFNLERVPLSPSGSNIGINCGGRGPKRWPLDKFIELGKLLAAFGHKIDFILGPEENHLRPELESSLPGNCRLLPLMSLPKLMGVISTYDLFISSDTGPMHLAWSLKVPVIAIFIDSELDKFRPLSSGSKAIMATSQLEPKAVAEMASGILNARKITT
jgi:heptosyltransferase III